VVVVVVVVVAAVVVAAVVSVVSVSAVVLVVPVAVPVPVSVPVPVAVPTEVELEVAVGLEVLAVSVALALPESSPQQTRKTTSEVAESTERAGVSLWRRRSIDPKIADFKTLAGINRRLLGRAQSARAALRDRALGP